MISFKQLREKCWAGYHAVGMKKKNGKMVPNCVPKSESVSSDDDYRAKKKALQDIQNDPKQMAVVGRDKLLQRKDKLDKEYQDFKNKDKLAASVKEDAPANAVGDGSAVAMPPAHEPGVHVKKKKKNVLGLLKREDYDRVELENVINKISSNQDIEEKQIKPIVNNIKMKKDKGTYTEEFGMRAFRYVVDTEITETVSEEYRNKIASSLLAKYE
tara:strand:+ start:3207 stop:3848 length:642 start_codon:yes stop_codon:yes gene_type:complete